MNESTTPAPTMSRWDRLVSLLPKQEWMIIGWVLAIKVLLFVVGPKSVAIFDNKRLHGLRECLEMWNRWDSLIFQRLAHHGYHVPFDLRAWPLFPWCIRLIGHFTGDYFISALLISSIASIIAAILLRRVVRLDYANAIAQRAVWFFLIFPTAYILHVGYTESFFLALTLGCFSGGAY